MLQMEFNEMFDRLWGFDGIHPFGDPYKFEEYINSREKEIETETCEFIKGNFKTIITYRFNKQGFMIGHSVVSHNLGNTLTKDDLENQLSVAIENENYKLAADLKKQINELGEDK